ncbi:MAG TPA: hypothetical protein VK820_00715 [Steroidobacteraceae bacterium]|nr:hypothetical protein [Steroidobacteraceae bacterium]
MKIELNFFHHASICAIAPELGPRRQYLNKKMLSIVTDDGHR